MKALATAVVLLFCSTLIASEYTLVDLGEGKALGINNSGQVISDWWVWENGTIRGIAQPYLSNGNYCQARGINNNGQITGICDTSYGSSAFVWDSRSDQFTLIPRYGDWSTNNWGTAINDSGVVVGQGGLTGIYPNAVAWDAQRGHFFAMGNADARNVNSSGAIVGQDRGAGGWAYMCDPTSGGHSLVNNWAYGFRTSAANAINDLSVVVGTVGTNSPTPLQTEMFIWDEPHGCTLLGSLNTSDQSSCPFDINNSGVAVGQVLDFYNVGHAFVWSSEAGMRDLNNLIAPNSGWRLEIATGINDSGWIVGYGTAADGLQHAFLLVPEPATVLLLGLGGLILRRR